MEPECSLPCSQQPDNSPYPEPDESNPYFTRYFPLDMTQEKLCSLTHICNAMILLCPDIYTLIF
jgi:hypothetical protein